MTMYDTYLTCQTWNWSLRIECRKCCLHVSKRQSGVIPFYEVNFLFFVKRVHSLRNQQTRYVCQKMNFIVVYYYFIDRFLIFNFSSLTEPEGVRKEFWYNFVFKVLLENN
jgi:hypothetical protein